MSIVESERLNFAHDHWQVCAGAPQLLQNLAAPASAALQLWHVGCCARSAIALEAVLRSIPAWSASS